MPPFHNFTVKAQEAIRRAHELAIERGQNQIDSMHLLAALVLQDDGIVISILEINSQAKEILGRFRVDKERVMRILSELRGKERVLEAEPDLKLQVLERYAKNLTKLARQEKLEPVIGREEEIKRIMQILSRRTKNNPVLIGEAGVGKTAIVEGLASMISRG